MINFLGGGGVGKVSTDPETTSNCECNIIYSLPVMQYFSRQILKKNLKSKKS